MASVARRGARCASTAPGRGGRVSRYYIEIDGEPKPVPLLQWACFFEQANRRVALTKVGVSEVSTVFLGLDHNLSGEGPPLIYETMVFGGKLDGNTWRYSTRAQAVRGHGEAVMAVAEIEQGDVK